MSLRLIPNLPLQVLRFPTATTITRKMSTGIPSGAAAELSPTNESIGVKHTAVNTVPGVSLTPHQKVLVGSVLDVRAPRQPPHDQH